jgi:hypothetical protein
VLGVVRAVKQGYSAVSSGLQNRFEGFFVPLQLGLITTLELCPLLAIVTEPLRSSVLGATSFSQTASARAVFFTPRGHNLSTRNFLPSLFPLDSYTRFNWIIFRPALTESADQAPITK